MLQGEMFEFYKTALSGILTGAALCGEYKSSWRNCGDDKLAMMKLVLQRQSIPYFNTFCYKGKGLSKEYILKEFGEYLNGYDVHDADGVEGYTSALYVDYDYDNDLVVRQDTASLMWCVGTSVVIPSCKCPVIYVSNRSKVHLVGEGFNTVQVYLFDESEVTVEDIDSESKVVVYKYSDACKVEKGKYCFGEVKEFDKELRI